MYYFFLATCFVVYFTLIVAIAKVVVAFVDLLEFISQ